MGYQIVVFASCCLILNKVLASKIQSDTSNPVIRSAFLLLQKIAFEHKITNFAPEETWNSKGAMEPLFTSIRSGQVGNACCYAKGGSLLCKVMVIRSVYAGVDELAMETTFLNNKVEIGNFIVENQVFSVVVAYEEETSLIGLGFIRPMPTAQKYKEMAARRWLDNNSRNLDSLAGGWATFLATSNLSLVDFEHKIVEGKGTFVFPALPAKNFDDADKLINKILEMPKFKSIWKGLVTTNVSFACVEGQKYNVETLEFEETFHRNFFVVIVYTLSAFDTLLDGIRNLQIEENYKIHTKAHQLLKTRLARPLPNNIVKVAVEEVMCARTIVSAPFLLDDRENITCCLQAIHGMQNVVGVSYHFQFSLQNMLQFVVVLIVSENPLEKYIHISEINFNVKAMDMIREIVYQDAQKVTDNEKIATMSSNTLHTSSNKWRYLVYKMKKKGLKTKSSKDLKKSNTPNDANTDLTSGRSITKSADGSKSDLSSTDTIPDETKPKNQSLGEVKEKTKKSKFRNFLPGVLRKSNNFGTDTQEDKPSQKNNDSQHDLMRISNDRKGFGKISFGKKGNKIATESSNKNLINAEGEATQNVEKDKGALEGNEKPIAPFQQQEAIFRKISYSIQPNAKKFQFDSKQPSQPDAFLELIEQIKSISSSVGIAVVSCKGDYGDEGTQHFVLFAAIFYGNDDNTFTLTTG